MSLPGTEVGLTGLEFPESSIFPLFKSGVMFSAFQPVGTSLDCYDFSNMMGSSLAIISSSSLRTCGCPTLGSLRWS